MANNWEAIDLKHFLPPAIPEAVSDLTRIIDEFLTVYRVGITTARAFLSSLDHGEVDVLQLLIQALTDLVEGFLQAGKIHVLFVPIPKMLPPVLNQAATVPPTLDDIAFELGFDFRETAIVFSSGANEAYSDMLAQRAGNAAFFRTFVDSISDPLDVNRPQYINPGDAVAMTVLLVGAPSFSQLVEVASSFNRLFRPSTNMDLTSRMVPVPQGLRAKVIGLPAAQRIGVRLDWSVPAPVFTSPYFPAVTTRVVKYAVIRSTDARVASSATNVLDFFSTKDLVEGLTSDDSTKSSKVIAVGSGANSNFVDDDPTLDRTKTYFYCVAWQIQVDENGATKTLPFDRVSNVAKTFIRVAPAGQAQPPNWTAYGSAIDIAPEFAVTVRTLLEELKTFSDRLRSPASATSSVLQLVEKNADEFGKRLDDLNARIKRLAAVLNEPMPGLYSTSMTGLGGNAFLIGELAARIQDKTDPNRPPFDDNEYVMGICLVAGGPRMADITPAINFFKQFFGAPDPQAPLLRILTAMDAAVDGIETVTLGPNLKPLPRNADGTVTLPNGQKVDPATIDPNTGLPRVTPKPVIADDGQPVDTMSPKNPYAGDP